MANGAPPQPSDSRSAPGTVTAFQCTRTVLVINANFSVHVQYWYNYKCQLPFILFHVRVRSTYSYTLQHRSPLRGPRANRGPLGSLNRPFCKLKFTIVIGPFGFDSILQHV